MPGVDTVKLFCPNCNDIYTPSSSRFSGVDGAFFGTTFAHLFFHTYREYCPAPFTPGRRTTASSPNHLSSTSGGGPNIPPINPNQWGGQKRPESRVYTPKIYGFKVSERAKSGPRMAWLRMRPPTFEDLNSVDSRGRWIDEPGSDLDDDKDGPSGGRQGRFDEVSRILSLSWVIVDHVSTNRMTTTMNLLKRTKRRRRTINRRVKVVGLGGLQVALP